MRQKMSRFTRNILSSVDQNEHRDALYTLRKSSAARKLFAELQYHMAFDIEDTCWLIEIDMLLKSLETISREVSARHIIKIGPFRPRMVWPAGRMSFKRLAETLAVEIDSNEWNDSFVRTIDGWWQV